MMGVNFDKGQSDKMTDKLMRAVDPTDDYTYEEFTEEFSGNDTTTTDLFPRFQFNFVNKSNNEDPEYASVGASGFDLRANIEEPLSIESGRRVIVPTGLYFEIPTNFEMQIRPRSGLAAKHGITVLNSPGTIDADYRGEIKIILINHSDDDFIITNGERIAQAVIASVIGKNLVNLNSVDSISVDTERGSGGFGSTGTK